MIDPSRHSLVGRRLFVRSSKSRQGPTHVVRTLSVGRRMCSEHDSAGALKRQRDRNGLRFTGQGRTSEHFLAVQLHRYDRASSPAGPLIDAHHREECIRARRDVVFEPRRSVRAQTAAIVSAIKVQQAAGYRPIRRECPPALSRRARVQFAQVSRALRPPQPRPIRWPT